MGELKFDAREYLVLEVVTDEGVTGLGFGMTRDAPLGPIVIRNVAPRLIGADPLATEATWERLYNGNLTIGQRGLFMRCLSAADIALWDIKAQVAGLPLWQLLGGFRERIGASMAGGYPRPGPDARLARRGGRRLRGAGLPVDQDRGRPARGRHRAAPRVRRRRRRQPARLRRALGVAHAARGRADGPDAGPSSTSRSSRIRSRPSRRGWPPALREQTGIPLALGEDVTGRHAYRDLIAQAPPDILRLDATTTGGISEAIKICAMAAADSIPVLPHIFPELHVHLAAALPIVMAVEVTDPAQEIDLLWNILADPLRPVDGHVTAPTGPGIGAELDRAALARYATGVETLRA